MGAVVAIWVVPRKGSQRLLRKFCRPAIGGIFPLRLSWQSHAYPTAVGRRVFPADPFRRKIWTFVIRGISIHDPAVCRLSHFGAADPEAAGNDDFLRVAFETIALRIFWQAAG